MWVNYFTELIRVISSIDEKVVDKMKQIIDGAERVFVIGNGGSMATAVHFAGDLSKNVGIPSIAFDNLTALTARANDDGYGSIFVNQLEVYRANSNDVLVAISTSGCSTNVVQAVKKANELGVVVLGLTAGEGGLLFPLCDMVICLPESMIEVHEDVHMAILHSIIWKLK